MSDAVAIDPSVALCWLLDGGEAGIAAAALLRTTAEARLPVLVAPTFYAEVAAALHRSTLGADQDVYLTAAEAETAMSALIQFPFRVVQASGLYGAALKLAQEYRLSAFDHALNIASAGIAGCELWTADAELLAALNGALPHVRPVAEYGA